MPTNKMQENPEIELIEKLYGLNDVIHLLNTNPAIQEWSRLLAVETLKQEMDAIKEELRRFHIRAEASVNEDNIRAHRPHLHS